MQGTKSKEKTGNPEPKFAVFLVLIGFVPSRNKEGKVIPVCFHWTYIHGEL